jgi:hypothetical protein
MKMSRLKTPFLSGRDQLELGDRYAARIIREVLERVTELGKEAERVGYVWEDDSKRTVRLIVGDLIKELCGFYEKPQLDAAGKRADASKSYFARRRS